MSQGVYTGAGDSDSGAQENPLAVWLRNVPTWLDQVCWPSFIFYKQRVTQRKCIILYNCLITKNKTRSLHLLTPMLSSRWAAPSHSSEFPPTSSPKSQLNVE